MGEEIDTTAEFSACEEGHLHVHIEGTAWLQPVSVEWLARRLEAELSMPDDGTPIAVPIAIPLVYVLSRDAAREKATELRGLLMQAQAIEMRQSRDGVEFEQ